MIFPARGDGRWPALLARAHAFLLDRFRTHLEIYLVLCGGLTLANLCTGPGW